jgi:hypothetical protein
MEKTREELSPYEVPGGTEEHHDLRMLGTDSSERLSC